MATTYHINADTGNDTTGDGSEGLPWLTFAMANSSSIAGDTINVQDSVAIYDFTSLTFDGKDITGELAGSRTANGNGSILDGGGADIGWTILNTMNWLDITIRDISKTRIFNYSGTDISLTCTRCIFKDIAGIGNNTDGGMFGSPGLNNFDLTLISCVINNITASNPTSTSIFRFRSVGGGTSTFTVTGCVVFLPSATSPSDTIPQVWQTVAGAALTVFVKNSIFSNTGSGTISVSSGTFSFSDFNNIGGSPTGTGVITADPLFVDETNSNFNLRQGSPATGTGTNL